MEKLAKFEWDQRKRSTMKRARFELKRKLATARGMTKQIYARRFIRSIYFTFKDRLNLLTD